MSVTVCLEAPLQALNYKRRKADVQASILLPICLAFQDVWQQQVVVVAGDNR